MKVTDAFLGEHAIFYLAFDELERASGYADLVTLKARVALLSEALQSHARLEDQLLFDSMEAAAKDVAAFEVMRAEHAAIERRLHELTIVPDVERARDLVREFIEVARDHFRKEEMIVFGLAEEAFGREKLVRLGEDWAHARGVQLP